MRDSISPGGWACERATELLRAVNLVYRGYVNLDCYKVESYMLSEFVFGNESDRYEEANFTSVTGLGEWVF